MGKLRVVVAEDHQGIRRQLVRLLGTEFEIVDAVSDGRSLLTAAIALKPDVVVSDVYMPLLNGPQVFEYLSERGYEIPFVFTSTDPQSIGQCPASFVPKIDLYDEIIPAVRVAATGNTYIALRYRS